MEVISPAEQLFFTTVRVDTVTSGGNAGSGTAFLFSLEDGGKSYPFIVTNKHVISEQASGCLTFLRGTETHPVLGDAIEVNIEKWADDWFVHPDPEIDIAILPLVPIHESLREKGLMPFYRHISSSFIPSEEAMQRVDAIEEITFIGYPNGIWDSTNLLPIARRGTTATPISIDYEGKPRFLIDASVFPGSSGSPVFILNTGSYAVKTGGLHVGRRLLFVGVVSEVYCRSSLHEIVPVPIPTNVVPKAHVQEMIDLGIVLKPSCIVETIFAFLQSKNITTAAAQTRVTQ